jgi:hypothetical protein
VTKNDPLGPMVERALQFLESSPRGASRRDILSALNIQPSMWPSLRAALEATGLVVVIGRGPGLRHVHKNVLDGGRTDDRAGAFAEAIRTNAREALVALLRERGEIDSRGAQEATGLTADASRRLLQELIRSGRVVRVGQKRATRYRWKL